MLETKTGKVLVIAITIVLVLAFASCTSMMYGPAPKSDSNANTNTIANTNSSGGGFDSNSSANNNNLPPSDKQQDDGTTDQMFTHTENQVTLIVTQIGGKTRDIYSGYSLDIYSGEQLRDGAFYEIVADVEFLNGGIAGYVDFPDVKHIYTCKEVHLDDLDLPYLEDELYGLTLIGDWADADALFYENGVKSVWKDGKWIYSYDDSYQRDDGSWVLIAKGTDKKHAETGIEDGTVLCAEWFALPLVEKD